MQAEVDADEVSQSLARNHWLLARDSAVAYTKSLLQDGIHKQITNRLLEPFMWHVALITATEWDNFFHLRDNKDAHPDFRDLAHAMRELYEKRSPSFVNYDEWHAPLVTAGESFDLDVEGSWEITCKVSVGRCARVSYLTHDGKRDPQADIDLCERLLAAGHMSPLEHVARPMTKKELEWFRQKKVRWNEKIEVVHFLGNFQGWAQYRKLIEHEDDILGVRP